MDKVSKTLDHLELIRISLSTQGQQLRDQLQTLLYSRSGVVISSHPSSTVPLFPTTPIPHPLKLLRQSRAERFRTWLFLAILVGVWGWWNSKLLFSTVVGIGVITWVYRLRKLPVHLNGWNWYRRLETSQRQFFWAVSSGVSAGLFLYLSLSIWSSVESPEIALSVIGQNLGILGILSFIIWQWYQQKSDVKTSQLDQWLGDLTQDNPLKRLIAVRQLTQSLKYSPQRLENPQLLLEAERWQPLPPLKSVQGVDTSHIVEYFQLMLYQENEPLVREALLEGLQILESDYQQPYS